MFEFILLLACAGVAPSADVLAIEKSALERWAKGDPDGFLEILDPDIAFFDPSVEKRADGLEAVRPLYEAERGKVFEPIEIRHPKVQLAGDCAVLTFHLVTSGGGRQKLWNGTEVFRRTNGRWLIIHSHYSLAKRM